MRWLFEFLSIFDFITPTVGIVETFVNDPTILQTNSWTIFVPYNQAQAAGWNANDVEAILSQHGIRYWGSAFGGVPGNQEFFLSVPREQAQLTERLLLRAGVPLSERFVGAPPPKSREIPENLPPWDREKLKQGGYVSSKNPKEYRTWCWVPCLEGLKSCKGKPTCTDCGYCADHCKCVG